MKSVSLLCSGKEARSELAGGNTWTETYGYDPNFDYLTSVNYGDGNPNAIQNWTYDAAGNRTDSVCDNLNRPVTIGGVACTSDILGNRLTTGSTSMSWDCLNRMTGLSNASGTWNYLYRADGMRVSKTNGTNTTIYRYDGQMSMEDVDTGSNPAVTDYAIGARGIDAISKTVGSNTVVVYPIYDAHGNMVADVSRAGNGSFAVNDKRTFDAWGNVRSGATSGDPKGRYCANLGHVQDDESGLVYMRARYYEPASGRFVSQDQVMQGVNWFVYCDNNPISLVDSTGNDEMNLGNSLMLMFSEVGFLLAQTSGFLAAGAETPADLAVAIKLALASIFISSGIASYYCYKDMSDAALGYICGTVTVGVIQKAMTWVLSKYGPEVAMEASSTAIAGKTEVSLAAGLLFAYDIMLIGCLVAIDSGD